jgi:hypothetical protein
MDTRRSDDSGPVRSDGVSRREVLLGIGAGGLTIALFARGIEAVAAQEATPSAGGLPPGVALTPLINIPVPDVPTGPFTLSLTRLTLEAGASIPESTVPFPEIAYVESGTLMCPGGDGRWVYAPDGTVTASGAGDYPVPAGSAIYVAPNALDGGRNDGTEQVVALVIDFIPAEDMGTPSA